MTVHRPRGLVGSGLGFWLRAKLLDPHNVAGMHEEVEAVQKPSEN